jgi:hypothetical protein
MPRGFRLVLAAILASSAAGVLAIGIAAAAHPVAVRPAASRVTSSSGQLAAVTASRPSAAASPSHRRHRAQLHRPARGQKSLPAVAANAKKGVSVWAFRGVGKAMARSGASWYYTWAPTQAGIASPARVHFVPMIWGGGSVTTANLRLVRREGPYLLGFNEPDNSGQSNLTVRQALQLWPRLIATGMKLGSPAVATDAAAPGGWLDRFMRGAAARHYRVSFITVHWYGQDFATDAAVGQLRSYLQAIHARYRLPIWLTEFALIRFGASASFPSPRQQAAFVTAAAAMLERLPFVQRYAWFALPATPGDGSAGLFRPGALATAAGRAFEAVDSRPGAAG